MDQWLVRTSNNIIAGPYARAQVLQLIQDGKLGPQDEVCQANRYWIYLHEHQEVQSQLGIQMPKARRARANRASHADDDEITETQIEAGGPDPGPPAAAAQAPTDDEGGTAVISRGAFSESPQAVGRARLEPSSVWRGLIWLMLMVAGLLVVCVIRLLRGGHHS